MALRRWRLNSAPRLKDRVAFESRATLNDGFGNTQAPGWIEQISVAASIEAKLGGETVLAARLTSRQPVNIVVRQSTMTRQITTDWRARDVRSGATYAIRSIVDPDQRRVWLELLCETGVEA